MPEEEDVNGQTPDPSQGIPNSQMDIYKYLVENKSISAEGYIDKAGHQVITRVSGDVPARMKAERFSSSNKNVPIGNYTEDEIRSFRLKERITNHIEFMLSRKGDITRETLLDGQRMDSDFNRRLTLGRGATLLKEMKTFRTKQEIEQRVQTDKPAVKWS
jgi:hypothetical protein